MPMNNIKNKHALALGRRSPIGMSHRHIKSELTSTQSGTPRALRAELHQLQGGI